MVGSVVASNFLAKLAARVMGGESLESLNFTREIVPPHFSVKEAVLPFAVVEYRFQKL